MKRMPIFPVISLVLFLFSCSNEPAKEETKADTAASVVSPTTVVKPVFTPFNIVISEHKVKNFEKSAAEYLGSDSLRKVYGITHFVMGRSIKDSNVMFVMDKIEDLGKAKTYFDLPQVKKMMSNASATRGPSFTYAVMVRKDDSPGESALHVAVSHHVKDFDIWLKAYDADSSGRSTNGLVESGIARNLYDSNTVSLIFAVTDSVKAIARMASPELKKIMTDAGVDGTPSIRWYREVK